MRYLALASDYDGTLALDGRVNEKTLAALERLRDSGRKLILVTGRELDELLSVFPQIDLFERVVAENGALLYRPASREEKLLGDPPPAEFVRLLSARGVGPISVGRAIVATRHPHETVVLEVIRDLGLELQVIFNKGAVMVLPAGVNKATGIAAVLPELGLSPHNVVGVGDAENDHAFLRLCEAAVAVANALPMVKETADMVTAGDHGDGVIELIDALIADDLHVLEGRLTRHHILLGMRDDDQEVRVKPYGSNLLIAGSSGSGKSALAIGFLERLVEQKYQVCVIDPEGDYGTFEDAVALGNTQQAPNLDEILQLLDNPEANAVVNLVALPFGDRPAFFVALLSRLQEMRVRTGRPHWFVVDEAHHVLPASWQPTSIALPQELDRMVFITVEPHTIAPTVLAAVDTVVAVGDEPEETLRDFCETVAQYPPGPLGLDARTLQSGEVLVWERHTKTSPFRMRVVPGRTERRRHRRKYAEGELPADRSFYFRGPEGKLNLRAQNLILFMQIADGVDDDTWVHHLRQGDYARWFREGIKDEALAEEATRIAEQADLPADESRVLIKAAIERDYTLPASSPSPGNGG